jgi:hypothetical protein
MRTKEDRRDSSEEIEISARVSQRARSICLFCQELRVLLRGTRNRKATSTNTTDRRPSVGRRVIGRDEERTNDILPMKPNWPRKFCMKFDIKTNKPLFILCIFPMICIISFSSPFLMHLENNTMDCYFLFFCLL